jgi:hypothetical protein
MEEIKVEVKIKVGDLYNFFMYHTYSRASGIFSAFFGLAMFGLLAYTYGDVTQSQSFLYFLFGLFFLVFNPMNFYARANKQIKTIPTFKEPINYTFNNAGISTIQDKEKATIKWNEVQKVVSTGRSLVIYVSKVRANILPKESIGDNYNALVVLIQKNLEPSKVKFKVKNN